MTIFGDLVDAVREQLQDADKDRYTDERIIRALNLGIIEMRRLRPDYFIGRYHEELQLGYTLDAAYTYPDVSTIIIIKYAVGWVEMADDEYTNDGRAVAMLGMFKEDLTT